MSQPHGTQAFVDAIARRNRSPQFQPELSPLEKAFSDYQHMENELASVKAKNEELLVTNMNLVSEVQMLREAYERSDADRLRLQAISSTLLGRLLAINDCIGGAVKASIKDGIEAAQQTKDSALEQDAEEAQSIIQRLPAREDSEVAPRPIASPRARQDGAGIILPQVEWQRGQSA